MRVSDYLKRSGAEAPMESLYLELKAAVEGASNASVLIEQELSTLNDELNKHTAQIDAKRNRDKQQTPRGIGALVNATENWWKNVSGIRNVQRLYEIHVEQHLATAMTAYRTSYAVATNGTRILRGALGLEGYGVRIRSQ